MQLALVFLLLLLLLSIASDYWIFRRFREDERTWIRTIAQLSRVWAYFTLIVFVASLVFLVVAALRLIL
jgi:hypothetical protein